MSRTASPSTSMIWRRCSTRCGIAATTIPARRFLLADRPEITRARLALSDAIGQIIRNGLGVMGVAAAEEMQ